MWEKFKSIVANEQVFTSLLLILVGVISFGLGRASLPAVATSSQTASVQLAPESFIMPAPAIDSEAPVTDPVSAPAGNVQLVASKSGSRYHLPDCPSVGQIKESNKVYFASRQEAEAAGYTKAANCPGL